MSTAHWSIVNVGFCEPLEHGSLQSISGIAMNQAVEVVYLCTCVSTMLVHRGVYSFCVVFHSSLNVGQKKPIIVDGTPHPCLTDILYFCRGLLFGIIMTDEGCKRVF